MRDFKAFNDDVVRAVVTGAMNGKVCWLPGQILYLRNRIKYHQDQIAKVCDKNVYLELKHRLLDYQNQLSNFDYSTFSKNNITKLQLIYDHDNAPDCLFYINKRSLRYEPYRVKVKFSIDLDNRKKTSWSVEDITPSEASRLSYRVGKSRALLVQEVKGLDKIPNILLTLPSLITEDVIFTDFDNLPEFQFNCRKD